MGYWQDRQAKAQNAISNKNIKDIEKQMRKYYAKTMENVIGEFEATYNKLLATIEAGREPTPADLYKLDKYWAMQAQARTELEKLGAKQIALLSKKFELNWFEIYHSISLQGSKAFNTVDRAAVQQMINQIWVADGKSWSSRIWGNTEKLLEELNEGLLHIVASGKKNRDLKNLLQERFGVSYGRADALVRTEVAHIQTQAAQKRYEDYGIKQFEVWADEDERRCDVCGKLHEKRFFMNEAIPVPAHPRCRCCIVPVVEDEITQPIIKKAKDKDKNDSKALAAVNKTALTQEVKNDTLTEPAVQRAQQKVKELQQTEGNLTVYDKKKPSHIRHVKEILGVEEVDKAAWAEYEKIVTDFLKKDIDNIDMEGFITDDGWLYKYEASTGRFGLLSKDGTISTFFVPSVEYGGLTPEEYWKKILKENNWKRVKKDG